jgi:hypothetical protein
MLTKQASELVDLPLHLQEQGGAKDGPFTLEALDAHTKRAQAALHSPGNGALIAMKLLGSPRPIAMPKKKI